MLNPRLYEINTRVWLRRFHRSSRQATLEDIPSETWEELARKGIEIVWLMGVWSTNPECTARYAFRPDLVEGYQRALPDWREQDVVGSPYAIDDYSLNPDLGTPSSLKKLKRKLNGKGLKLILDFIPNHFCAASRLIARHPGVFLQANEALGDQDPQTYFVPEGLHRVFAHGRDPYFPAWSDTIQVNYFSPAARDLMIDRLLEVARLCDGVRCDMAMLPLNDVFQNTWQQALAAAGMTRPAEEFWPQAIGRVKESFPEFIFLAEAYWGKETALQEMGFDFTYDKTLTDLIKTGNANAIRSHLIATSSLQPRSAHFLENHDEERSLTALGREKSMAGAVIISTLPGLRLYHDGQFEGKRVHLPLQLGREPIEPVQEDIAAFYRMLLETTKDPIFTRGSWTLLTTAPAEAQDRSCERILAWLWQDGQERRLIVINFADSASRCSVKLDRAIPPKPIRLTDLLSQRSHVAGPNALRDEALPLQLEAYQSQIWMF